MHALQYVLDKKKTVQIEKYNMHALQYVLDKKRLCKMKNITCMHFSVFCLNSNCMHRFRGKILSITYIKYDFKQLKEDPTNKQTNLGAIII